MKLRKLLYSIKMYKFYRVKVNSKKVVIASVSEAIQYLLDCFVADFYFHFSRTALEIILLAMMLSQVSSFGVALAFYLQGLSAFSNFRSLIDPFALSLVMTGAAALFFALNREFFRISQEGVIGFGYLLASGIVVIIADRITHEAHDIADILFGSAVVVDPKEVYIVLAVAVVAILIHWIFFKDFIFVSFDSETARLFKYPVRILNTVLLLTVGVVIAVTTRALGALPVFALVVLPALTAFFLTERLNGFLYYRFYSGFYPRSSAIISLLFYHFQRALP